MKEQYCRNRIIEKSARKKLNSILMLIKEEGSHFSFYPKVESSRHAFTLLDIFIHMELNIIPVGMDHGLSQIDNIS